MLLVEVGLLLTPHYFIVIEAGLLRFLPAAARAAPRVRPGFYRPVTVSVRLSDSRHRVLCTVHLYEAIEVLSSGV